MRVKMEMTSRHRGVGDLKIEEAGSLIREVPLKYM